MIVITLCLFMSPAKVHETSLTTTSKLTLTFGVIEDQELKFKEVKVQPKSSLSKVLASIINCESGGNPQAKNPSSSAKGLFQILDGTWNAFGCEGNPLNATDNYNCGYKIATQSGVHHWNESKSCWSKKLALLS